MVRDLERQSGLRVYPRSVCEAEGTTFCLGRQGVTKALVVAGEARGFEGGESNGVRLCPLTASNAAALRERLPWLRPQPLGIRKSVGCGDRLGLATPGHVRALRRHRGVTPIFAQQSVRENARTGRSPQEVLDDATWGLFEEGWREPWGADADHLKTTEDAGAFVAAGFTFFTVDPGEHVDHEAHHVPLPEVLVRAQGLPWEALADSLEALRARYVGRRYALDGVALCLDEPTVLRAAAKYGRAILHAARIYRHLHRALAGRPFDLEVSIDETEAPTSPEEHLFIASELRRLGVRWVSLAPRYVGRFEKGVDYIGDLAQFDREIALHAAIARALGPYKLSIHSGSDKFAIYPLVARHAGALVHLKTAGTSYLEALRAIAGVQPDLFRAILAFAHEHYEHDRVTYHVSARLERVPPGDDIPDAGLPGVLDLFDARQVLHVTFGSVLDAFGPALKEALARNEEAHYAALEAHFARHLEPFANEGVPWLG